MKEAQGVLLPFNLMSVICCKEVQLLYLLRCESLVLYRIMYGNRAMKVQRRNNFVVGSDNTENFLRVVAFVGVMEE